VATVIPFARVARAEAAYKRDQKRAEAEATATSLQYGAEHRRSDQVATRDRMEVTQRWADLNSAIGWLRREWQGALPGSLHKHADKVEPEDVLGAPELNARWRSYMEKWDSSPADQVEPIRAALAQMAAGPNRYDRLGALYLFIMTCRDYDPVKAGWGMRGQCVCIDPEAHALAPCPVMPLADEYAPWYALQAIERLRQVVVRRAQRRPGVRHISESQAIAEAEV
jgi:hypothetical protein